MPPELPPLVPPLVEPPFDPAEVESSDAWLSPPPLSSEPQPIVLSATKMTNAPNRTPMRPSVHLRGGVSERPGPTRAVLRGSSPRGGARASELYNKAMIGKLYFSRPSGPPRRSWGSFD